jgi:hypothetical protein
MTRGVRVWVFIQTCHVDEPPEGLLGPQPKHDADLAS